MIAILRPRLPGDEADVVEYRDMVTILRDRIKAMVDKGATIEQVKEANLNGHCRISTAREILASGLRPDSSSVQEPLIRHAFATSSTSRYSSDTLFPPVIAAS